jgi:hypothetical protein
MIIKARAYFTHANNTSTDRENQVIRSYPHFTATEMTNNTHTLEGGRSAHLKHLPLGGIRILIGLIG